MAGNFFARYQAGERIEVWRELREMGERVFDTAVIGDATAVANEFVARAWHNLTLLQQRLNDLGYCFAHKERVLVPSGPEDIAAMDLVEREMGRLPIAVRAWYQQIGSVDFRQARFQLRETKENMGMDHAGFEAVAGLGSHPVLIFEGLSQCLARQRAMIEEAKGEGVSLEWVRSRLPLGGTASNCDFKGIELPCNGVDGVLYNAGFGEIYFVDEVRSAFEWGGFPFWHHVRGRTRSPAVISFTPDYAQVLPLLKEGLLPI